MAGLTPLRKSTSASKRESIQSRRLKAATAYGKWANKPWNRARMMIVSWVFGKKGWQLFNDSYFLVRLETQLHNMQGVEPETWWQALTYDMIPGNVQIVTGKQYETSNQNQISSTA